MANVGNVHAVQHEPKVLAELKGLKGDTYWLFQCLFFFSFLLLDPHSEFSAIVLLVGANVWVFRLRISLLYLFSNSHWFPNSFARYEGGWILFQSRNLA